MKKLTEQQAKALAEIFEFEHGPEVVERIVASGDRIKNAFAELFSGYGKRAEDVLNETIRTQNYSGLVVMRDVSFYTFCEHHFLPFYGTADIAYEPGEIITGLGKLVRLVREVHAARLQIQEVMTRNIAEDIMRVLGARGAFVATRAKHLCICSRGPSDDGAWTEVQYGVGTLERSGREIRAAELPKAARF
jgi:GTP cyclohydrolase I